VTYIQVIGSKAVIILDKVTGFERHQPDPGQPVFTRIFLVDGRDVLSQETPQQFVARAKLVAP